MAYKLVTCIKRKNCAIGGIMLKGIPSEQEEVVIGYYTLPPYMGQGYMTESIIALKTGYFISQM